ncbi:unnamed protein product [Hyaloperonospora brassicae]|uniref:RXLR phytopathogen effector protein WY-domain domain-containing protein n=1 Tax=Hyaloperonospora brassicae TaxID=162125 RepID=A0AAV0UDL4_HYABA|nr:unnamed protein product [Hyaloperonospora brassicae]
MRLLCLLLPASAIFLSRTADSATSSGNPNINAAVNSVTVPLRVKTNASVALPLLAPHPFARSTRDASYHDDEEREGGLGIARFVGDVFYSLQMRTWLWYDLHPEAVLKQLSVRPKNDEPLDVQIVARCLAYADLFTAKKRVSGDDVVFRMLDSITGNKEKLVALLLTLRNFRGMKNRADSLQRAVAGKYPELEDRIQSLWLKANVRPDEAYDMMPIAAEKKLTHGIEKEPTWPAICRGLTQLISYARKFNAMDTKMSEFSYQNLFELLVEKRGADELAVFSYSTKHEFDGIESLVHDFRVMLVEQYPEAIESVLQSWFDARVHPVQVYKYLPLDYALDITEGKEWLALCSGLKLWISYMISIGNKVFSNNEIVRLLVDKRSEKQAVAFLSWLESVDGMKDHAERLQEALAVEFPDSLPLLLEVWLKHDVDPKEVYRRMSLTASKPVTHDSLNRMFNIPKMKMWFGYVEKLNADLACLLPECIVCSNCHLVYDTD